MSKITIDEIKALKRPFPLDKHTLREGHKEGGKIRWFVYVDRSAVQDLLDEVFPGEWETQEPKMYPVETRTVKDTGEVETSHEMSATMGITIRGLTRWDGGESDDGSTKSAITNAFRRTAAYGWGIARYLYDMDIRIKTDTYSSKGSDGRWQTDWKKYDQIKQQAWDMFVQWYNREFGPSVIGKTPPQTHQEGATGVSSPANVQSTTQPVKTPQQVLGTPSGQRMATFTYERAKMFMEAAKLLTEVSTPERNNTIIAMEGEGAFKAITSYQQGVDMVVARVKSPEHGKKKAVS